VFLSAYNESSSSLPTRARPGPVVGSTAEECHSNFSQLPDARLAIGADLFSGFGGPNGERDRPCWGADRRDNEVAGKGIADVGSLGAAVRWRVHYTLGSKAGSTSKEPRSGRSVADRDRDAIIQVSLVGQEVGR